MESVVSPLSQELAHGDRFSDQASLALDEIFMTQPMRDRIVSYKFWKQGGVIAHASDTDIIGKRFNPTDDLRRAWSGEISGSFEELDHAESAAEAALGIPLLEVYSPIRELWSGEIIAVAEFNERADQLEIDLAKARRTSWLIVGSPGLASRVLLQINADTGMSTNSSILDDLTHREEEILRHVAKGLSNREIADELDLQEKTVKHYMTAFLSKLHARNRVEAALIAHDVWNKGD